MKRKTKTKKAGSTVKKKKSPAQRTKLKKAFVVGGLAALGAGIAATAYAAVKAVKKKSLVAWQRGTKLARKNARHVEWQGLAWAAPVLFLGFTLMLAMKPSVQYPIAVSSAKLVKYFEKVKPDAREERIAFWSEQLYQNPNLLAPLGRGPELNDTSPLFPRGYDCTTYVETVGALSRSDTGTDLADKIIEIRYKDGLVGYSSRNHFPEADWIPNNADQGTLRDITLTVAKKSGLIAPFAHKEVDKYTWFKKQRSVAGDRAVAAVADEDQKSIPVRLPYIPLEKIKSVVGNIPQGSIINVVRESKANQPVLITHQGFLIWKNGIPFMRHASSFKEISEVPLTRYIASLGAMPWKVVGININQFR